MNHPHTQHVWTALYAFAVLIPLVTWWWLMIPFIGIARITQYSVRPFTPMGEPLRRSRALPEVAELTDEDRARLRDYYLGEWRGDL